jgi:hypothetical protein
MMMMMTNFTDRMFAARVFALAKKRRRPMSNSTPGPWTINVARLSDNSINVVHVIAENGSSVAQISSYGEEETLTNTRLIAAAPDMLAALQWIVEIADKNYEQDDKLRTDGARTLKRISDRARVVIAKAEG